MKNRIGYLMNVSTISVIILFCLFLCCLAPYADALDVTNNNDSGSGSLRSAIANTPSGGTINFNVTGTITLTSGELSIDKSLIINGPGANQLTVSGNNSSRVFNIGASDPSVTVTIKNLKISNGKAEDTSDEPGGGGILNYGVLTLSGVTVSNNTASCTESGCEALGGGIFNHNTLTLTNSAITINQAYGCYVSGAGIYHSPYENAGDMTLVNVTISGNNAVSPSDCGIGGAYGGGIYFGTQDVLNPSDLTNVTVYNNSVSEDAQLAGGADGGGIYASIFDQQTINRFNLLNTIIAQNFVKGSLGNCSALYTVNSLGYNLSDDDTCSLTSTGDIVTDPSSLLIAPTLGDNGGPTQTHALLAGSPAIDAGNNSGLPPTDQRGYMRIWDGDGNGTPVVDIGAYEYGAPPPSSQALAVPSMTEWGMIMFVILAGLGSVHYMSRQKRANS